MLIQQDAKKIGKVTLKEEYPSLEEYVAVARYHARVELSEAFLARIRRGREEFEKMIARGVPVYGVNTGFGDNVRFKVDEAYLGKLQENIVLSHGTSVGQAMKEEQVRVVLFGLMVEQGKGYSAARPDMAQLAAQILNNDIYPYVPWEGTVGGLTYVPYIAQLFMGEGRCIVENKIVPAAEVLKEKGIAPLVLKSREGLSALNVGCFGLPSLVLYDAVMAFRYADVCNALVSEALQVSERTLDPRLIGLKKHPETQEAAAFLRKLLAGSGIIQNACNVKVQDSVSNRIMCHVSGTAARLTKQVFDVFMEELASATCNPVFLPDGTALMGANWDRTMTGSYEDVLAIAVAQVAKLMEVHMERMVTPDLSGLPAFLVKDAGLNSGFMIVQYVTAGLYEDIVLLANPGSTYNVAVSAGQESPTYRDEACLDKLSRAVSKLKDMVMLTMLTALQAVDFVDGEMSPVTKRIHDEVRKTVTFMEKDDAMYKRYEAMQAIMDENTILSIVEEMVGDFVL